VTEVKTNRLFLQTAYEFDEIEPWWKWSRLIGIKYKSSIFRSTFIWVTYNIGGGREGLMRETFNGEPFDRAIFIIAQTVIIAGEQISCQCVVGDLNSKTIIHPEKKVN